MVGNNNMSGSSGSNSSTRLLLSIAGTTLALTISTIYYLNRFRRSKWLSEEDLQHGHETTHSVIDHFKSLILSGNTTVEEANKKRTTSYYLKMRDSHNKSLVLGIPSHSTLLTLRQREISRILHYWSRGNQSHRTIVVMCDDKTRNLLADARREILEPLEYTSDIDTKQGCWIPPLNIMPVEGKMMLRCVMSE